MDCTVVSGQHYVLGIFVRRLCVHAELVMYWIGALCSSTERAKARLWKHQYIDYGYEIPDNIMALLLGLTFCIISPLIAPIALLYFVVNSVIGKYTLIYVYAERFQGGGKVGNPSTEPRPVPAMLLFLRHVACCAG